MKQQLQNKVWGSAFFSNWVRTPFTTVKVQAYLSKPKEEKQLFWDRRINLELVRKLFRPLQPVDLTTAWEDTANGWRQHIVVCIREAAHAFVKNQIAGDEIIPSTTAKDRCMRQFGVFQTSTCRTAPAWTKFQACLAARRTGRYTLLGDAADDI